MAAKKATPPKDNTPNPNLSMWHDLEVTDPSYVKKITGKTYQGNSPHPTWLVMNLTRVLGPVGHGFGWRVIEESYVEGQPHRIMIGKDTAAIVFEKMHQLRIEFWTKDPDTGEIGTWESYGGTRALYLSNAGKWIHDEDAAKKSLTDAITKAASFTGSAADIFLGRWDDNKYVAQLKEEFANGPDYLNTPGAPQGKGAQASLPSTVGQEEKPHISGGGPRGPNNEPSEPEVDF